jgi:cyclase
MNRLAILGSIVAVGLAAACATNQSEAQAQGQPAGPRPPAGGGGPPTLPGITAIEQVAPNLYKIFGAGGNTVVWVMADGVALVDTKLPNNGQAILDEVRKVTDKPVTLVINTHSHPDHNGSNQFFKDQGPSVKVVAQANTAARMAVASGPFPANPATDSFADSMTLGTGADRIELRYFGPGHTNGDAFVIFPQVKAMMMGDIMAWSMAPLIDGGSGGSAIGLADTMEKAVASVKGVDIIIEGHGYVTNWQRLVDYAAYSRALVEESKKALAAGKTPRDVRDALVASGKFDIFLKNETLPGLEYGGTGRSRAQINATVAFAELKGEPAPLIMNLPPDQQ